MKITKRKITERIHNSLLAYWDQLPTKAIRKQLEDVGCIRDHELIEGEAVVIPRAALAERIIEAALRGKSLGVRKCAQDSGLLKPGEIIEGEEPTPSRSPSWFAKLWPFGASQ